MQKTELKNLHFSMRYLRIQRDKTPIGFHGEEGKSNLSDGGLKLQHRSVILIEKQLR